MRRLRLIALFLLVLVAAWSVWGVWGKERESAALRSEAEVRLTDMSDRQTQLKGDVTKLKTGRGVEEVLREQYALAAEGEGLVVIVDPPNAQPVEEPSPVAQWLHKLIPWW